MSREAKGFSLIELLAVIAVVCILVALLLPLMSSIRTRGDTIRCVSNLRSSGIAMKLLFTDSRNNMDQLFYGGSFGEAGIWGRILYERDYVDIESVRCPVGATSLDRDSPIWYWETFGLHMPSPPGDISTSTNGSGASANFFDLNLVTIDNPSKFVLLADSTSKTTYPRQTFRMRESGASGIHLRHEQFANVCFLDGHVMTLNRKQVEELNAEYSAMGWDELIIYD